MKVPACMRENVPLASMTTFRVGGPAKWFAEPCMRDELVEVLAFAKAAALPVKVLGGGSNLLVSSAGIDAVVVRLSGRGEFGVLEKVEERPDTLRVGAAVPLQSLLSDAAQRGLAGLEFMAGIPGRIGGAVAMNAGSGNGGIGKRVVRAEMVYFSGKLRSLDSSELGFRYRGSDLVGCIATAFVLRFDCGINPEKLLESMRSFREKKRASQPLALPSAGCVFKNPANHSAGALLDQAGCKGMAEGGAEVSAVHANFIVNTGGATSHDVATLAGRMRDAVAERHGIVLEPELVVWGGDKAFGAFGAMMDGEAGNVGS